MMNPLERRISFVAVLCFALFSVSALAASGPFDGKRFKGRIAYSADGNFNDPDDWSASPISLAILAACGLQDRLVHFDYNCIMPKTDPEWEKQHAAGVLGAAERFGFKKEVFQDCQKDLQGAIASIKNAVNASSADDPLYFILAGPMEAPFLGIEQSDPARRQYVICISHSCWNDGYNTKPWLIRKTKRDVIALGVRWVQIGNQGRLATGPGGGEARASKPEEWRPWLWMKKGDLNLQFLLDRTRATTRADCSDSGMTYFLVSGDEQADLAKYKSLLGDKKLPKIIDPRGQIRLEAENFPKLEACAPAFSNQRQVSQRVHVAFKGAAGRICTSFHEPYAAASGLYEVDVRYAGGKSGACEFKLLVNGKPQGPSWKGAGKGWQTRTIPGVNINDGDDLMIEVKGEAGLDYVQLNLQRTASPTPNGQGQRRHPAR